MYGWRSLLNCWWLCCGCFMLQCSRVYLTHIGSTFTLFYSSLLILYSVTGGGQSPTAKIAWPDCTLINCVITQSTVLLRNIHIAILRKLIFCHTIRFSPCYIYCSNYGNEMKVEEKNTADNDSVENRNDSEVHVKSTYSMWMLWVQSNNNRIYNSMSSQSTQKSDTRVLTVTMNLQ